MVAHSTSSFSHVPGKPLLWRLGDPISAAHIKVHSAGWQHLERVQHLGGRWSCQRLLLISILSLLQKERLWQMRLVNLPDAVTSLLISGQVSHSLMACRIYLGWTQVSIHSYTSCV